MKCWMIGAATAIIAISGAGALRLAAQERGRDVEVRPPDAGIIPGADRDSLDRLDYSFQERFQTIDGINFGLSRIPTMPEHNEFRTVRAQTPAEKQAIAQLAGQGKQALFMVAGLRAITFRPRVPTGKAAATQQVSQQQVSQQQVPQQQVPQQQAPAQGKQLPTAYLIDAPDSPFNRVITQPIWLSGKPGALAPPKQSDLLSGVKESFAAFPKKDRHEFMAGEWRVMARPVRIGKSGCLKCHQQGPNGETLHNGDVVGAALYLVGTAPARAASAP